MRWKFFFIFLIAAKIAVASDWPEFRGNPARNGIWNEPGLPATLPKDGPQVLWKYTLGAGYSGPAVAEGRLYVLDRLKPPAADVDTERVVCLDANSGKEVWVHAYPCALKFKGGYENGPRSTPTVRAGKVYTLGSMAHLHCLDAASGKVLWEKNLLAEYKARIPWWGMANSPLIEGQMVILQAGGDTNATVMAFDQDTGRELWRSLSDKTGYSTMVAINSGGQRQLIVWTGDAICSLNPTNGEVFWRHPRTLKWDQAIATPTFHAGLNMLFISADREGTIAFQLDHDKPGAKVAWDNFSLSCLHTSPVLEGDYLFGLNHNGAFENECGEFRCVKAATGEKVWAATNVTRLGRFAQASVTRNAGNNVWYLLNELGELILARADAKEYRQLARAQLIGKTWSQPAYANKKIYARSETSLICASLE